MWNMAPAMFHIMYMRHLGLKRRSSSRAPVAVPLTSLIGVPTGTAYSRTELSAILQVTTDQRQTSSDFFFSLPRATCAAFMTSWALHLEAPS